MKKGLIYTLTGLVAVGVVGSAVALGLVKYQSATHKNSTIVFSKNEMLLDMWNSYKKTTIEQSTGRTVDSTQDNISTSEGQSYALLRAVWMDDRSSYDKSLKWTQDFMQRPDKLLSWKYGPLHDGTTNYGIQKDVGGQNTASDGDIDTALSLLMAYKRWNEPKYLEAAKPMIAGIWDKEVVEVAGKPVLAADDIERLSQGKILVNPSYFATYAFKLFAKVDKSDNWTGLADNSYTLLDQVMTDKLGSSHSSGLPPDWVQMDRKSGAITASSNQSQKTDYGYDAMRVSWRLGLDWQWNQDRRAKQLLEKFSLLSKQWDRSNQLAASYSHSGVAVQNYESPAMYGAAMGYFSVIDPGTAHDIYTQKLQPLYDADTQAMRRGVNYYDANWGWFGIALEQHALPNIAGS